MSSSHITLNPAQHAAVTSLQQHILVLAGAGSGKTRVLVERIAWLIKERGVKLSEIVAVTFTNKAANEMKARLVAHLGADLNSMWVGTFHSIAHRLLRLHAEKANLKQDFQIIDSDDSLKLVKKIQKELGISDEQYPPKEMHYFIMGAKEQGLRAAKMALKDSAAVMQNKIYRAYEQHLLDHSIVDFTELLLRAKELLEHNPDLREHYQQRFAHILVDEFQDTNPLQYAWLKLLASGTNNFMMVGDDDQSIYGWRGACVENIKFFTQEFKNCEIIRLEQNYRSTKIILEAANHLISQNRGRLGKELWTESAQGEKIKIFNASDELDEAEYVINICQQYQQRRLPLDKIAILYRSNAQSRVFEEALLQRNIPYRIYGGLRFFERAEIKDALAYLRLIANNNDNASFERIINWPTRGIGLKTVDVIRNYAKNNNISLFKAMLDLLKTAVLSPRAKLALQNFRDLILSLQSKITNLSLEDQVAEVVKASGLIAQYQKEKGTRGQSRIENLQELVTASREFNRNRDYPTHSLQDFLAHAVLEAGETQSDKNVASVNLMTLHSAKGLEFDTVFIVGLEEGLFPHKMSMFEDDKLEEERRLCYVGITRACKHLHMCHATQRRLYGREDYCTPSRFIREIPAELLQHVNNPNKFSASSKISFNNYSSAPRFTAKKAAPKITSSTTNAYGFKLGDLVKHAKFGMGVILNEEGTGQQTRVLVEFKRHGSKWLVLEYAKLTKANSPQHA